MSILLNSDKRDIKEIYVGVNGIPQKVKEGYVGVGGVPKKFYSAISYDPILNNNTWEQIAAASSAGNAQSIWSVGDQKEIEINGTVGDTAFNKQKINVFIIGFNHNASVEGNNKIHFLLGKIEDKLVALVDLNYGKKTGSAGAFTMNTTNTTSGGWESSHMRKKILGSDSLPTSPTENTLLAALPDDLRAVMKPITKYTDNKGGGNDTPTNVTKTTDYLPLLAEFEAFGTQYYANSTEQNYQEHYAYFKSGNERKACNYNETGTPCWWWLRSPSTSTSYTFRTVYTDGSSNGNSAGDSMGVAAAFAA